MRKDRLLEIAEVLEAKKGGFSAGFSMSVWGMQDERSECGTVACLAGHVIEKYDPEKFAAILLGTDDFEPGVVACELLDLDPLRASQLFLPEFIYNCTVFPTAADAAKVVRHLVLTGVVDWTMAGVRFYRVEE